MTTKRRGVCCYYSSRPVGRTRKTERRGVFFALVRLPTRTRTKARPSLVGFENPCTTVRTRVRGFGVGAPPAESTRRRVEHEKRKRLEDDDDDDRPTYNITRVYTSRTASSARSLRNVHAENAYDGRPHTTLTKTRPRRTFEVFENVNRRTRVLGLPDCGSRPSV